MQKVCTFCKIEKDISNFYFFKSKNVFLPKCKSCWKEYRERNKDRILKYHKEYYRNNKNIILIKTRKYQKKREEHYSALHKLAHSRRNFGGNKYLVLERDNFTCQKCHSNKKMLVVHHIDGMGIGKDYKNNNLNNLVTLCQSCHARIHAIERWNIRNQQKGA